MLPLDTLSLFFLASVALVLAPGPDNIFVLTQSALHGRAAGLFVTLGLCTGLMMHTTAVALGVAAAFQSSAMAYEALKAVGIAYLVYLAWHALRAGPSQVTPQGSAATGRRAFYSRGILMNITNPKVAIFFLAYLPQFANPSQGSLEVQLFLLGAVFISAALIVFGSITWTAGLIGPWLKRSERAQVIMNRIAGVVFVALALRLAIGTT